MAFVDKKQELHAALEEARVALRAKDFAKASRVIGVYESKQFNPPSSNPLVLPADPRATNRDVKVLERIFTLRPKILKELAESEWEPLHIAYALNHLFHGRLSHAWFPDEYVGIAKYGIATTFRMLDLHYNFLHDVERMRAAGITQGTIRCSGSIRGSCDVCVERNERIVDLGDMPELPYEHCTSPMGCRCLVQAHFLPKS